MNWHIRVLHIMIKIYALTSFRLGMSSLVDDLTSLESCSELVAAVK